MPSQLKGHAAHSLSADSIALKLGRTWDLRGAQEPILLILIMAAIRQNTLPSYLLHVPVIIRPASPLDFSVFTHPMAPVLQYLPSSQAISRHDVPWIPLSDDVLN